MEIEYLTLQVLHDTQFLKNVISQSLESPTVCETTTDWDSTTTKMKMWCSGKQTCFPPPHVPSSTSSENLQSARNALHPHSEQWIYKEHPSYQLLWDTFCVISRLQYETDVTISDLFSKGNQRKQLY